MPAPTRYAPSWRASIGLFVLAAAAYLLSTSREDTWADARPIYEVAERLVVDGKLDIRTRWPHTLPLGKDGKVYAVAPLLQSLMHVPGAQLREWAKALWPATYPHTKRMVAHFAPAWLGALALVAFLHLCLRQGVRPLAAVLATLAVAFCTMHWVYARYAYSEALQAATFTLFFAAVLAAGEGRPWWAGLRLGLTGGLLFDAKAVYAVALAGAALHVLVSGRRDARRLVRVSLWGLLGFVPLAALQLWYNHLRWGDALSSGYDLGGMRENPLVGLWGLLFSPGKSVFVYAPPLVLAALGLPAFVRRRSADAAAMAATILPVLLVVASMLYWHGDFAWGPRYFAFAVPVACLPLATWIDDAVVRARGWRRAGQAALLAATLGAGAMVQVAGNAFYWDHWIRLQREARASWLGAANQSGSPFFLPGNGECGPCFEDLYAMHWLPPFHPVVGHLWLLPHVLGEHDAARALEDAPWRRHTRLPLGIAGSYPRFRLDWWYEEFKGTPHQPIGTWLIVGLSLLGGLGAGLLGWGLVRARPAPTAPTPAP